MQMEKQLLQFGGITQYSVQSLNSSGSRLLRPSDQANAEADGCKVASNVSPGRDFGAGKYPDKLLLRGHVVDTFLLTWRLMNIVPL